MEQHQQYDLIVIGSGPAGQKGAIAAAKAGKRVVIIDKKTMVGGVSLHRGTIPSKTLREVIIYLSGLRQRAFYGDNYKVKQEISTDDLASRVELVEQREMDVVYDQLYRNGIQLIYGMARFVDQHTVEVEKSDGIERLQGEHFLIACGTRPASNPEIPFDGETIIDVDQILNLKQMPKRMIIVGAGVIGLEYGSMFSAMGVEVTLIDHNSLLLPFVDEQIMDELMIHLENQGTIFRLAEKVEKVEKNDQGLVRVQLESGFEFEAETFLYAVGIISLASVRLLKHRGNHLERQE